MTDELNYHLRNLSIAPTTGRDLLELIDQWSKHERDLKTFARNKLHALITSIDAGRRSLPSNQMLDDQVMRLRRMHDAILDHSSSSNIYYRCSTKRCVGYFKNSDLLCELCNVRHCPMCHRSIDEHVGRNVNDCTYFRLYTDSYCGYGHAP